MTWEKVREIRRRYAEENVSYAKLATIYGVGENALAKIIKKQRWKE